MAHMRLALAGEGREDTPALRWGRLVHMAVLEPVRLAQMPRWDGGRKGGREWAAFESLLDAGGHEDYLSSGELPRLFAITESTRRALAKLPHIVATEARRDWTGAEAGEMYGAATARIDALLEGGGMLEVKTTRAIDERAFLRQAYGLGYHLQLGWYARGISSLMDQPCYVLAIESAAPHCCAVYRVPQSIIADGYAEACRIALHYRCCEACGSFPGPYDEGILDYSLPEWAADNCGEVDVSDGNMEASEL